ncbi:hypothetical protein HMPREF1548_04919 [Clostridium sp. KLE 1755]|nr:hypothetical protein HMPREF1548_04919 [Clostridium sp. KLE 1755]
MHIFHKKHLKKCIFFHLHSKKFCCILIPEQMSRRPQARAPEISHN